MNCDLTKQQNREFGTWPDAAPDNLAASSATEVTATGIGHPRARIDGIQKVLGAATFAAEFALDRMVYASLVFSRVAKGRIASIDVERAEQAPGVVLVMSHRNAPRLNPTPALIATEKSSGGNCLPVLQDDRIHWNGQPIAAVLAESQEEADYAASLIEATYEAAHAATCFEEEKNRGTELAYHMGEPLRTVIGDARQEFACAARRVDNVYSTPRHNHNAIELHAATVVWEGDVLRVHDASQSVSHTAWSLAQVFGIDENNVHVTSPFVGGGFGAKLLWEHHIIAAAASRVIGRPVRIVLSREGVYRIVGGRSLTEQRVAIGASSKGHFSSIIHTGTVAKTPFNVMAEPFILGSRATYAATHMQLDVQAVELDMVANTFMRGPGEAVGTFALESAIDELAYKMGLDPIEIRLLNEPELHPVDKKPFSSHNLSKVYRTAAERFGWSQRKVPRDRSNGDWLIGMGCATTTYPYYRMPGGAARIRLRSDGTATVSVAAHEMGMGTATVHTQIAASLLGLPESAVQFAYGDSALPGLVMAAASQQTAAVSASIEAAKAALVNRLLQLVEHDCPLRTLTYEQVVLEKSGLSKLGDSISHLSYAEILSNAGCDEVEVVADAPPPSESDRWAIDSCGAMFAEVQVNEVTGEIRVSRFLGAFDCGRILNPRTAASQFRGGIIMGIGLALMEETLFDERTGRIANPSITEYHMPVHLDVPPIDVIWTDIPDPQTPLGARGIGEIGITGVAAAIANAVFNATGRRVRDLPITLDKLI